MCYKQSPEHNVRETTLRKHKWIHLGAATYVKGMDLYDTAAVRSPNKTQYSAWYGRTHSRSNVALHSGTIRYILVWNSISQYGTVYPGMVRYIPAWYGMSRHGTVNSGTELSIPARCGTSRHGTSNLSTKSYIPVHTPQCGTSHPSTVSLHLLLTVE